MNDNLKTINIDGVEYVIDMARAKSRGVIYEKPKYTDIATFVYTKYDGYSNHDYEWRSIGLVSIDDDYICGYDLNDNNKFKKFCINKILGGITKIFTEKVIDKP